MKYRIKDLQFEDRYFGGGEGTIFNSKEEIVEQLASYHDIDFTGVDDEDNELTIKQYFKFWEINGVESQLNWLLNYGEWAIEEVK